MLGPSKDLLGRFIPGNEFIPCLELWFVQKDSSKGKPLIPPPLVTFTYRPVVMNF